MDYILSVALGIVVTFVSGLYLSVVPELRKTNVDQQRQLDDLKRELEEMKRKQ